MLSTLARISVYIFDAHQDQSASMVDCEQLLFFSEL